MKPRLSLSSYLITLSLSCVLLNLIFSGIALADSERPTPELALQRLLDGNQRFVQDKTTCLNRNQARREATAAVQQKPFAVVLGCSDSRVPPEIAFDQGLGDVFVVRVAGNVVSAIELDSVEFSALVFGSSIVMVLGHESCGAVNAVLHKDTKNIEAVAEQIKPALKGLNNKDNSLEEAIKANVRHSVDIIKKSPVIAKLMKDKQINVVGGYYSLQTGEVKLLEDNTKQPKG